MGEEKSKAEEPKEQERRSEEVCSCGKREGIRWVANPFMEDIYDKVVYEWFCDDCYQEQIWEI